MIGKLKGIVDSIFDEYLILDVQGVGYLVFASLRVLEKITLQQPISLWIESVFAQDQPPRLFGFQSLEERDWFKKLQTVQGVGGKAALNILSALDIEGLKHALFSEDVNMIKKAEGIGPKLATRIVSELKGKILSSNQALTPKSEGEDAVLALVNLGYKRPEALDALKAVYKDSGKDLSIHAIIPAALKILTRK